MFLPAPAARLPTTSTVVSYLSAMAWISALSDAVSVPVAAESQGALRRQLPPMVLTATKRR